MWYQIFLGVIAARLAEWLIVAIIQTVKDMYQQSVEEKAANILRKVDENAE